MKDDISPPYSYSNSIKTNSFELSNWNKLDHALHSFDLGQLMVPNGCPGCQDKLSWKTCLQLLHI